MSLETKDVVAAVKRRPLLSGCGALALALVVLLYFRWDVPAQVQGRLEEREKEFKRLTNNVKFSAQLDAQLESLRAANERIAAGALREAERARNQQLFLKLEAETGVTLVEWTQQVVPPRAKGAPAPVAYISIPFTLSVRGRYEQLIDFLNRLDSSPTLARVTSATLNRPDDAGVQNLMVTVELLGFRS